MISDLAIARIQNVLCLAEMNSQTMPYHRTVVMNDGPSQIPQVTYSIGFTQYGTLADVLADYKKRGGIHAAALAKYPLNSRATTNRKSFRDLLAKAGREDQAMRDAQDHIFKTRYLDRAFRWAEAEGFMLPLSYLVIADSFLHSGSMMTFLRQRFAEKTPKNGGNEKKWTADYVKVRHEWLRTHSRPLLRKTIYRTTYLDKLIAMNDWDLDSYHTVELNGTFPIPPKTLKVRR
jgi:chitosanase